MPGPNRRVSIEELPDGTLLISSNFEPGGERHEMRARSTAYAAYTAALEASGLFSQASPIAGLTADAPPRGLQPGDDGYVPF